jgi:hypothetical protein
MFLVGVRTFTNALWTLTGESLWGLTGEFDVLWHLPAAAAAAASAANEAPLSP